MAPFEEADRRCALIASRQCSLINRTQARRCGHTDKAIEIRLSTSRWVRVLPEVFLLAGGRMDDRGWMMAAFLWGRDDSAVSFKSAASMWGLDGFTGGAPYHLTTRSKMRAPDRRIILHSSIDLSELEVEFIGSVGVTSVRRTLFDLAAIGHPRLERALDQCRREQLTSLEEVWLMIDRPSSFGRRGVRRLRNLVLERDPETAPTQSEMEDRLLRIVRKGGIDEPTARYPLRLSNEIVHVDFAYPEIPLAIECDSYAWHMDREAFERDRQRDAEAQLLGWRVLRVTWAQLRYRPNEVLAIIRNNLTREVALSPA